MSGSDPELGISMSETEEFTERRQASTTLVVSGAIEARADRCALVDAGEFE